MRKLGACRSRVLPHYETRDSPISGRGSNFEAISSNIARRKLDAEIGIVIPATRAAAQASPTSLVSAASLYV